MHIGIIPIVSYEASMDVDDDRGITLKTSTITEIQSAVQTLATIPTAELVQMSRNAWTFARANHTRDRFAESCRTFANQLTTSRRKALSLS
jgi:hypothetical protein